MAVVQLSGTARGRGRTAVRPKDEPQKKEEMKPEEKK